MKKLLFILFALMFSLPCEASLSHNAHLTHTGLKPVPNSFQVAKSHFLPAYQTGGFSFDNSEDISVACPTSTFAYTKDNCTYPNIPQYSCGGRYRVCACDRSFAYSAAQCEAMGKVGGNQSCTVRGGSESGTVYYTACVCPPSYTKLTTGQNCNKGTTCSSAGEQYCDSTANIECNGNYIICDQNKSGRSGSCTAGGVTKYIDCYCDENLYPQTAETCKADFGENATLSGEICGSNERGKSCTCQPNALPDGYSESCGSQGYSASIDDGCGGTYYKCNDAGCGDSNYCGYLCVKDNGQCVECVSASDCGANEICSGNTCQTVDRCKDVSCSGGKSCNPNNGQCECPGDKPYESGSGCVVCTQDSHCKDGKKCNKATNLCEMVKEETCRTQAEAKGWTLITNGTEFIEALNAGKAKLAFVGKVYTSALSLILKADNAILEHATKVVGDLCTEPGSIEFETLQTNATIDINIPGTINHLYAESNSVININGNNFIVNKTSCDKNSTCRLNLQGRDIYLKEIEALSGSKLTVYGNNHNPLLYTNILKDDTLYPANVDLITIQSGSSITLAGGMSIGTIDMNGIDQNIQTSLIFGDGGYFVSRPYKYKKSYNFIEVDDCRNKGCIIHVGRQTGGSVNINMNGRGINYKASSGYNYAGSGSLVFNMMSSVLNNVGTISSSESYSRRYILFFFDSKGNTSSQFKFANGGFLGINRTYGGSANHFQCQYNFSGSISSASQCPTNTGNCTCSKY